MESMLGKFVIVRSSPSGVWFGRLTGCDLTGDGLWCVGLSEARRVWRWEGAGSCSGLAAHGPKAGKIAPPVEAAVAQVCEILLCTDEAIAQFARIQAWIPEAV